MFYFFFFFNDTATTEIYTLSLHDALPICIAARRGGRHPDWFRSRAHAPHHPAARRCRRARRDPVRADRKSTRLNSSHSQISYSAFCLKKKTTRLRTPIPDGPFAIQGLASS